MLLYCDNKWAINIAHNCIQHDGTKKIEMIDILLKKSWRAVWFVLHVYLHKVDLHISSLKNCEVQIMKEQYAMENIYFPKYVWLLYFHID